MIRASNKPRLVTAEICSLFCHKVHGTLIFICSKVISAVPSRMLYHMKKPATLGRKYTAQALLSTTVNCTLHSLYYVCDPGQFRCCKTCQGWSGDRATLYLYQMASHYRYIKQYAQLHVQCSMAPAQTALELKFPRYQLLKYCNLFHP